MGIFSYQDFVPKIEIRRSGNAISIKNAFYIKVHSILKKGQNCLMDARAASRDSSSANIW